MYYEKTNSATKSLQNWQHVYILPELFQEKRREEK